MTDATLGISRSRIPWYTFLQYLGAGIVGISLLAIYALSLSPDRGTALFGLAFAGSGVVTIGVGGARREEKGRPAAPLLAVSFLLFLLAGTSLMGYPMSSAARSLLETAGLSGEIARWAPILLVAVVTLLPAYLVIRYLEPAPPDMEDAPG